jgi:hypothetical protein
MGDVAGLAISVAILDRNHELFGEEGRQNVNFAILVSCGPFFFQFPDL